MSGKGPVSVSSAEFVRRFGSWQDRATTDPVIITHHGRPRLALVSANHYQELLAGTASARAGASDEAELRLAMLLDQMDAGFVAFDPDFRISAINMAATSYFRLRRDSVIGRGAGKDMPDLCCSITRAHAIRTMEAGEGSVFEAPAVTYPGQWLRLQIFPFGNGVGILFRNVTGERAVREADDVRTALTAAFEANGAIATGTLNQRAAFTAMDDRLAAMAGTGAAQPEHVRLTDLLAKPFRAAAEEQIEAVLTGGAACAFEARLLTAGGGETPVRVALAALRRDYRISGAIVVISATASA